MLKDQWGHVEEIELLNDGSGLGFGIVGGKTTGVVVRTLVPNSVADRVSLNVSHCFQTMWQQMPSMALCFDKHTNLSQV